jgi:hypothetical protein
MTADEMERPVAILNGWRQIEQAATPGPWEAEDNEACWKLFGAVRPRVHPLQLIKAPKHGTPYAEYWPGEGDSAFIVAARTAVPSLLAGLEAALKLHARQEKPVRSWDFDLRCAEHDWTKATVRSFEEVRRCPACSYRERWVCKHCRCPDDEWPCPTYRAITEALPGPAKA